MAPGLLGWSPTGPAASPGLTGEGLPSGWDFPPQEMGSWAGRLILSRTEQSQLQNPCCTSCSPSPATTQEERGPTCLLQGLKNSECLCPGAVCSLERGQGPGHPMTQLGLVFSNLSAGLQLEAFSPTAVCVCGGLGVGDGVGEGQGGDSTTSHLFVCVSSLCNSMTNSLDSKHESRAGESELTMGACLSAHQNCRIVPSPHQCCGHLSGCLLASKSSVSDSLTGQHENHPEAW